MVRPFRIGVVIDCYGPFQSYSKAVLAGVELPLITRGAHRLGPGPADGVSTISVAGRPVQLVTACEHWGSTPSAIRAVRELVDRDGVDAVISSQFAGDSVSTAIFASQRRQVTFMLAGAEPSATLEHSGQNVFRFDPDANQWAAGLGEFAYRNLGWRQAATLAEPTKYGWEQLGGFTAQFCSLGGHVTHHWIEGGSATSAAEAERSIPAGTDGVFEASTVLGDGGFMKLWGRDNPPLGRHLVASFDAPDAGVVVASTNPYHHTTEWNAYQNALKRAFPGLTDIIGTNQAPRDEMDALLRGLEAVGGHPGHREESLQHALAHLAYVSPAGPIRLDRRHQAIVSTYLARTAASGPPRQFAVIRGVQQTFGGYIKPGDPPASEIQPACHR